MDSQTLRILQINTSDTGGGAERIARNLFYSYGSRGHSSWLAVGQKQTNDPAVVEFPNDENRSLGARLMLSWGDKLSSLCAQNGDLKGIFRKLCWAGQPRRWLQRKRGYEDFNFPGTDNILRSFSEKVDIVHCHNLHGGYFDLRSLPSFCIKTPVVLTLHDAWLLSGHCAHAVDCERWKTGCGHCPNLGLYPPITTDATAHNWRVKRSIFTQCNFYVTTPSQWLMQRIRSSMLSPAIVESRIIPNGVPLHIFKPADRASVRLQLGLDSNALILLFVANNIRGNMWKDYKTLLGALVVLSQKLKGKNILFLGLGENAPEENMDKLKIRFIPFQKDPEQVALYYQAADVYVHATHADTFPNTVIEALACGIPVVATAVGGISEQVNEGESGYLVPPKDSRALSEAIQNLLSNSHQRCTMGANGAEEAMRRFSLEKQVDDYLDWYRRIVQHRKEREKKMPNEQRRG